MKPLHHLPPLLALVAITRGEVLYGVSTDTIPDFIRVSTLNVESLKRDADYRRFADIDSLGQCNSACGSIKSCVGYTFTLPRGCYLRYCRSSATDGDKIEFGGNDFLRYPFETEPDWAPLLLDEAAMAKFQQKAWEEIPSMCIRESIRNENFSLVMSWKDDNKFIYMNSSSSAPAGVVKTEIIGGMIRTDKKNLPYTCLIDPRRTGCVQYLQIEETTSVPVLGKKREGYAWIGAVAKQMGCCGATRKVVAPNLTFFVS